VVDADLVIFVIAAVVVVAAQALIVAFTRPRPSGLFDTAWVLVPAAGVIVLVVLAWRVVVG
jgi:hypothetical protein